MSSSTFNFRSCVSAGLLCAFIAYSTFAAPPVTEKQRREKYAQLARDNEEQFPKGSFDGAEALYRAQLEIWPEDPIASYNLACALGGQRRDPSICIEALVAAINNGYDDIRRMKRDPYLAATVPAREIQDLFSNWNTVLEANLARTITRYQKFVPKAQPIRDEDLKIAYISTFDANSVNLSKTELAAIARWATANIFPNLTKPSELALDPWVLLILPNRQNFNLWVAETYGSPDRGSIAIIGGEYNHEQKRLVAQDLGSTLRHEFMHTLHWRDMTRRGQTYPLWLQEGMCCLAEDYNLTGTLETGTITPAHSWRTNAVIRLERNKKALTIRQLSSMSDTDFSSNRPLATYAQARTFFMYLNSKNKLKGWYQAYCENYGKDSTAFTALRLALQLSEEEAEKDYKNYIRSLNEINENVPVGGASMGVEVSAGNGEGPVISMAYGHPILKSGDILLTFNRRPVRDIPELVRLLSLSQPGDETEFTLRRGKKIIDLSFPLVAK